MLRVGVVGYGYWGSKHTRVLSAFPDVEVTVIDSNPERLGEAEVVFPWVARSGDLDSMLGSLDAVVIATPAGSHARLATQAIERGVHVLVEKPLASSVREAEDLVELAERSGVVLMAGHTFEYHAAVWKLKSVVQSGELGDVYYIDTARLNLGLYQSDVNVIWDLAPHDVSIITYLLERLPTTVMAWGRPYANRQVEDMAFIQLRYEDPDVTAYIHVSWLDPCKVRRVTVVGSNKMAVYNDVLSNEPLRIYDVGVSPSETTDPSLHQKPMTYRYGDIVAPFVAMQEPLSVEDRTFLDSILSNTRPPSDGASGLAVVRVLEAAERSLRLGGAAVQLEGTSVGLVP